MTWCITAPYLYSQPLQHIIRVAPTGQTWCQSHKECTNICKGKQKASRDSLRTQHFWRTDKRGYHQASQNHQWECGLYHVKTQRRTAQPPINHYDHGELPVQDRPCVCTAAQPRKLPPKNGNRPITSTKNQKIPTKPSTIPTLHRRWWGD